LPRRRPVFVRGVEIVWRHHESWDGTGYPHRLAGTAIPFGARVYVTKPGGQVSVQIRVRGAGCSRTEGGTGWRLAPREAGPATLKG